VSTSISPFNRVFVDFLSALTSVDDVAVFLHHVFFICPIAIAYSIIWHRLKITCVISVCLSVRPRCHVGRNFEPIMKNFPKMGRGQGHMTHKIFGR